MNCPNCNSVVAPGSTFCGNCGTKLEVQTINNGVVSTVPSSQPVIVNNIPTSPEVLNMPINNTADVEVLEPVSQQVSNQTITITDQVRDNKFEHANNQVNVNTSSMSGDILAKSNNIVVIIIVAVIAIVTVAMCYFIVSSNNKKLEGKNDNSTTIASARGMVTVNGMTGVVPKGWSFVPGIELGTSNFDSVFVKDTQESLSGISSTPYTEVTLDSIITNSYKVKTNFEANGLSEVEFKNGEKNGVKYILFNGLYNGNNYHILYAANGGAGVIGAEGVYASSDDLDTIINFVTSLKRSSSIKSSTSDILPNFSGLVLQK